MALHNTGKGAGIAFIRSHLEYCGDECLIWPLGRDPQNGYGRASHDGKIFWAHRLMCQLAHGEPPSPEHQAAHSCGRGHFGCVHPGHLAWKTAAENQADRHKHGTAGKGCGYRFKLTPQKVAEIRSLNGLKTQRELAAAFGVSWQTIGMILRGEIWKTGQYAYGGFSVTPYDRTGMTRT